ncbi:MAG: dihydropteroate synthase [Bacteroidetes bacterium]|nr:dihydropteroate synthase [Bacteroidota bacterium]
MTSGLVLNLRGRTLDCTPGRSAGAHVAGILNVTPDSFYDGGRFTDHGVAMRRAEQILLEGAVMIDVGGASSRPRGRTYGKGAEAVPPDEEWRRISAIVEGIVRELPKAILSVDTFHADVAARALDAGAHVINDITALRVSPSIANLVADAGAGLILMHSVGVPGDMPQQRAYADVVTEVRDELDLAVNAARQAGVESIVVDPGFGFGKTVRDNLRLIAEADRFASTGVPVMIGVSRKSSIGAVLGDDAPAPPSDRLFGSLGATAAGVVNGATLVRTHDVRETVEMLKLLGETLATRVS